MPLKAVSEWAVHGFEIVGIAAIVIGSALATVPFVIALGRRDTFRDAYRLYRQRLGQAILLGLELLVAADIINTVGVDPTLITVAVLAGVVLIRTFLSFSLEDAGRGSGPPVKPQPATKGLRRPRGLVGCDCTPRQRSCARRLASLCVSSRHWSLPPTQAGQGD